MGKRISKRQIKSYIKYLEEKLEKKSEEIKEMQEENNESKILIYGLREEYLVEERLKGAIESAYYILNNC